MEKVLLKKKIEFFFAKKEVVTILPIFTSIILIYLLFSYLIACSKS